MRLDGVVVPILELRSIVLHAGGRPDGLAVTGLVALTGWWGLLVAVAALTGGWALGRIGLLLLMVGCTGVAPAGVLRRGPAGGSVPSSVEE